MRTLNSTIPKLIDAIPSDIRQPISDFLWPFIYRLAVVSRPNLRNHAKFRNYEITT